MNLVIPGGEIVLSNEEGIVISITGRFEGKPFQASWQATPISPMLLWCQMNNGGEKIEKKEEAVVPL